MSNINFFTRSVQKILTYINIYGFRYVGKNACIFKPLQINNPKGISLGKNAFIAQDAWLMGTLEKKEKGLVIGDNTVIGHYAHIIAKKELIIEPNVLIADKVFISDCTHNYHDINIPIIDQEISFIKPVHIGEGSWLGENVCVCGGSVGKHCVVGANSVVLSDLPDYCVAVGAPAKIVKKYNKEKKEWIVIENE